MSRSPLLSILSALALVASVGCSSAYAQDAVSRTRSLGGSATAVEPSSASYGGGGACLSSTDGRKAIQSSGAISLAAAAQVARGASPGEIVDYKICEADGGYSYVLTILARDGKVARAWVDAANGKLLTVR